jgi:hypothetical protein
MVDGEEQTQKRFVLSDRSLTLDPNSELASFFGDHIVESLQDIGAKAAFFKEDPSPPATKANADEQQESDEPPDPDAPQHPAKTVCQEILDDRMEFVFGSRDLAKRLWSVMLDNDSISDGDLAICRFRATGSRTPWGAVDEDATYLAIIKLDPVGAFRNVIEGEDTEDTLVTLESDPYVFPRRTDVLQKGAYIQRPRGGREYDLLLVDKQTYRGIAQFFTRDFMGADYVADAAEMTRRLFHCLISVLNDIRSGSVEEDNGQVAMTSSQDLYLGKEIYRIFDDAYVKIDPQTKKIVAGPPVFDDQARFDLEKWLDYLNLPPDPDVTRDKDKTNRKLLKQAILKNVSSCLGDQTRIERDLALVRHMTRRRSFSLQRGGTYSVPQDEFGQMIHSVKRQGNTFTVTFETTSWRENLR